MEKSKTKNEMARVVVQALRNMKKLPPADHFHVLHITKNNSKSQVETFYIRAVKLLAIRGEFQCAPAVH